MTTSHRTPAFAAILGVIAITTLAAPHPAAAQDRAYAVEPVAVTGEPAPGTGGLSYAWVSQGDLSDSSIVAFVGGPDLSSENNAIWVGAPGNLALAVRDGDPAPGRVAQTFYQFSPILVNASGDIWFGATLREGGALTSGGSPGGFWAGAPGNLSSVAGPGEPAPGTAGFTFGNFGIAGNYNDSGISTFGASIVTSIGDSLPGLWTGTSGSLELLALSGDPAPDTADLLFSYFADPVANNTGIKAFLASTADSNLEYGDGIWMAGPAGVNLLARTGEPAPGTGGRSFVSLAYGALWGAAGAGADLTADDTAGPVLNRTGDVAFNGFLAPYDPVTGIADEGVWIQDSSGLRLVTIVGDAAPGTTGLTFRDFNHINLNALGQVAFDAVLDSGDPASDHGIWLGLPDNLGLLAREGDPAPGVVSETFANLVMGPSLNGLGEIAFYARLNESNTKGIWAGALGDLALIAREGEALKVKGGDYRVISSITPFEGGSSAHVGPRRFNEAGQLMFMAYFTDGTSGLFLASPVVAATNQPPVTNAGPDLAVTENKTITLDGSGSFDPEGTVLSFVWSIDGVEVGSGPQFTAGPLAARAYTVTLTVTDRGGVSASDEMILTVTPNLAPVANAGPDQAVSHVQTVNLYGAGSSDPEGGALTYVWSLNGSQVATGATATVGPFAVGEYIVTLTVTDDIGKSGSDSMIVSVVNGTPVANAGPDRNILTLQSVFLDGSASSDPEGETISYAWSLGGVQIATGPKPIVGPFDAGVYTVTLTVTDDHGASASDETIVTVSNRAPTASAGPDQTVNHTQAVTLDGAGSSDPEGGALGYVWTLNGVQFAIGANPVIDPFKVGVHTVTLTVTDDKGATATDSVVITVINEAPVANAGPDQTVTFKGRNASVTVDGSASTDPEGGALSYLWTLDGQTVGTSAIVLIDLTKGVYSFTVTVTDDHGASATDSVVVTVSR